MNQHTVKAYGDELNQLTAEVVRMGGLAEAQVADAIESVARRDVALAKAVVERDNRLDALHRDIEKKAIRLIALRQPVASDLRTVVATLRMSSSLERMGDLARHVAQLTRLRYPEHVIPEQVRTVITAMCDAAVEVAEEVVLLLETQDLAHGDRIDALNEDVNALHLSVFRAIAAPDWSATPATTTDVTLASRYLERFTDHGLSVAAKVRYLVTGEWATHRPDATGS